MTTAMAQKGILKLHCNVCRCWKGVTLLSSTLVLELGQTFGAVPFLRQWLGDSDTSNVEPFFAVRIVFGIVASDHLAERHSLTEAVRRVVLLFSFFALTRLTLESFQSQ